MLVADSIISTGVYRACLIITGVYIAIFWCVMMNYVGVLIAIAASCMVLFTMTAYTGARWYGHCVYGNFRSPIIDSCFQPW